jgi:hypothetical protein
LRALVVLCVLVVGAVAAPAGTAVGEAVAPCAASVRTGVLPVWMRAGFQTREPRVAHVVGRSGRIGGVVFGWPLVSPPRETRSNKILWVSRRSTVSRAALWIRLQRMEGAAAVGAPVRRVVAGGPGPSIVDVPAPGCWRLTLTWAGRSDTLDLNYVPEESAQG